MNNNFFLPVMIALIFSLFACNASVGENKHTENNKDPQATDNMSFGEVIGTIFDATGRPIAEAGIAVTKGTAPFPEILRVSDEKGNYIWRLPPGKFTLAVTLDGYQPLSQEVEVKKGETVRLDFKLKKL